MFKFKQQRENYINVPSLPVLILDSAWNEMFPESEKNSAIKKSESELKKLVDEQVSVNNNMDLLNKKKKDLLAKIYDYSNKARESNSSAVLSELDKAKHEFEENNQEIIKLNEKAIELQNAVSKLNNQLFQECIKTSYNVMSKYVKEMKKIDSSIDLYREKLQNEISKKKEIEKLYEQSSKFLNEYIGKDGIAELDEKYNGSI